MEWSGIYGLTAPPFHVAAATFSYEGELLQAWEDFNPSRDSRGFIISYSTSSFDDENTKIVWNEDRIEKYIRENSHQYISEPIWSGNFITGFYKKVFYKGKLSFEEIGEIEYLKYDEFGNWTECKLTQTTKYPNSEPKISSKNIKRVITYYSRSDYSSEDAEMKKRAAQLKEKYQSEKLNNAKGPEWINGTWELKTTVSSVMGTLSVNARLVIDRDNQRLISSNDGEIIAKGIYTINDNNIHCDDSYFPLDMDNQRIGFGSGKYYQKVSDSYDYSPSSHSSYNAMVNFRRADDVIQYLRGKTFSAGGLSVKIDFDGVYLNGVAASAAPRVSNITSNTATILASSAFMGGQDLIFYLNADGGYITLKSGERLYLQ